MQHFIVFALPVFVGFQVIWNVAHALHTPLMAITNAISSIIILGALLQVGSTQLDRRHPGGAVDPDGLGQHLRRLPGDAPDAGHVPEELSGVGHMSIGLVTAAYIAAAVLFILALGGLSNQEKAKRAIWYGIVGMALAVLATIFGPGVSATWLILLMVVIGGVAGAIVAARVQMTQMPELVAGFHSLVGLAAVFIGLNADIEAARAAARGRRAAPPSTCPASPRRWRTRHRSSSRSCASRSSSAS